MPFIRPESVTFPQIWHKFQVNGENYVVQDLPENKYDEAIEHMFTHYLTDEPMCSATGILNDPIAVEELTNLYRELVKGKCILVCFKENFDEIVGINFTKVYLKSEQGGALTFKSEGWNTVYGFCAKMAADFNVFEHYNVDSYLGAWGLSIHRDYRGLGIGPEILKARVPLCIALNVPLTSTVFSEGGWRAAKKAGFEINLERNYINKSSPKLMSLRISYNTSDFNQ